MKRLRDHVVESAKDSRGARKKPRSREPAVEADDVRVIHSLGLDAATVALPAGVGLETRAARMNAFWEALVDFQYQDVIVIALCANDELNSAP